MAIKFNLSNTDFVIIDDNMLDQVIQSRWFKSSNGYPRRVVKSPSGYLRQSLAHFILNVPNSAVIDHRNGNTMDARRENLRLCDQSKNLQNKRLYKNNTTGIKGVAWYKKYSKWVARIGIGPNKKKFLGYFDSVEEAKAAYDKAAREIFGEFNREEHNVPEPEITREVNQILGRGNKSGYRGIGFDKRTGSWIPFVSENGKTKVLKRFKTIEEAVAYREEYLSNQIAA